ncbi:hypothetical protein [Empedobacter brevis]|uniref:hypothetical protein n=1 Tax=Empedobacter brevis TaxID=247 RepID=UPI003342BB68
MKEITELQLLEKGFEYYRISNNTLKFTIHNTSKGEVFSLAFPKEEWDWKVLRNEYGAERDCGYGGFTEYSVTKKSKEEILKQKQDKDLNYQISLIEKKFGVKLKIEQ